jgi:hypothetical protein
VPLLSSKNVNISDIKFPAEIPRTPPIPLLCIKGKCTIPSNKYISAVLIKLEGSNRMIGFKFVLPSSYPRNPPFVFLDEPENALVIEMIDYIDVGNVIEFAYLQEWRTY